MREPKAAGSASTAGAALRGQLLIANAALFWGASSALARSLFRDQAVPPLHAVELRILLALPLLVAWIAWRKPAALSPPKEDWGEFLVLGIFGVAAIQGSYYYAISVLGVGLAILIQYLAPALIVSYEIARGARPNRTLVSIIVAALAGTALLVGNLGTAGHRIAPLQWAIGFSSALTFAFYIVFSKRVLMRHPPERVVLYSFVVAGVVWAIVTPPGRILAAGYSPQAWWAFVLLAITSVAIPFASFNAGLRLLPASRSGVLAMLEPVIAIVTSALVLGEGLAPLQWLGAGLVLAASLVASRQGSEALSS